MVVLALRESPDVWELVRGRPPSGTIQTRNIAPSDAALSTGPVLIFTSAADPDALAAVRTLTALLKADLVRYEVHPVSGYNELRHKFDILVRGESAVEPRSVLCVNCGAVVDLEAILGLRMSDDVNELDDLAGDVRVFVLDSHRPYHLKNIHSSRVVVFDDTDSFEHAALPIDIDCEDEWGNVRDDPSSDEGDSASDDDDLSEDSDDIDMSFEDYPRTDPQAVSPLSSGDRADQDRRGESPKRKRPRRLAVAETSDEDTEREDIDKLEEDDVQLDDAPTRDADDSEEEVMRKVARRRRNAPESERRRKQRKSRRRSRRSLRDDPELEERRRVRKYYSDAKLGISSACVSHYVANVTRRANIDTVWMAILGATSQYVISTVSQEDYRRALSLCQHEIEAVNPTTNRNDEAGETSGIRNVGYVPTCSSGAVDRIAESTELRLDLLRHWSLHDSLLCSSYTATRLAAWRQTGKRRLLEMLATLGIPLRESQQKWCYMKQRNKAALEAQLDRAINRFDLGEFFRYESFVRTMPGHKGDISAGDFVLAVSALLEFNDSSQADQHGYTSDSLIDRFWRAYDALDPKRTGLLETGLEMAISAQRITADIGGDVIERRKFVPSGPFRYVFLRDQQFKEFITHPLLLRRLALFLKTALLRQGARDKPFIILAPDAARKKWVAVAATASSQKNDFGQRFRKAAESNGSNVTYDGFDSSVCEIEDGQEVEFVRFLHDVMR